jgi:hypothetical protein
MVHPPQRTALSGPALVRLLARLGETEVQASPQPLADRLSQWLGWTDAIALSTVLTAPAPAVAGGVRTDGDDEAQRCLSLRSALSKAIALDGVLAPARAGRRGGAHAHAHARAHVPLQAQEAPEADADYAILRQSYLALQQKMETDIGDLRGRLRSRLAAHSPDMARLAALDAAMERSLAARERSLLGSVPGLLGARFERLRKAAREAQAAAAAQGTESAEGAETAAAVQTAPSAWLDAFRKDMQSVLLAELDVRFQPVEGLLAALRAH